MSEETTTTETATEVPAVEAVPAEVSAEVVASEQEPEPSSKAGREAAKYRTQLRAVEAERDALIAGFETERDQLNQHLTAARTAMLAQHKRSSFIQEGAIGEVFPDPNAIFKDDGTINEDAYNTAFNEARDNRSYLFNKMIIPAEGGPVKIGPAPSVSPLVAAFTPKQH